jgi:adenine specific DNA methylase Mod
MNRLHYGDNLNILRENVAQESVDLIYLDPPFNSDASYNVLVKSPTAESGPAQLEATTRMRAEASAAGFYASPLHGKYSKIQILTIEELFSGAKPHLPWIDSSIFRKAERESSNKQGNFDL